VIEIINPGDARAVRNKNNVLELYAVMINQKKLKAALPWRNPRFR
jgi:hypothetical protein